MDNEKMIELTCDIAKAWLSAGAQFSSKENAVDFIDAVYQKLKKLNQE